MAETSPWIILFKNNSQGEISATWICCVSQETVTEGEQHASVYIKYGEDYQDKMIWK